MNMVATINIRNMTMAEVLPEPVPDSACATGSQPKKLSSVKKAGFRDLFIAHLIQNTLNQGVKDLVGNIDINAYEDAGADQDSSGSDNSDADGGIANGTTKQLGVKGQSQNK